MIYLRCRAVLCSRLKRFTGIRFGNNRISTFRSSFLILSHTPGFLPFSLLSTVFFLFLPALFLPHLRLLTLWTPYPDGFTSRKRGFYSDGTGPRSVWGRPPLSQVGPCHHLWCLATAGNLFQCSTQCSTVLLLENRRESKWQVSLTACTIIHV